MRTSLPPIVGLCLILAGVACEQELVAHWPLDAAEGNVLPDASGNGHDATFGDRAEGLPVFAPGMHGQALRMDGALEQFLTVAGSEALNFDGPFTAMAWLKPVARNATYEVLCFKGDKSGDPPWPGWRLRYFWTRAVLQVGSPDGAEPTVSSAEWSVPAGFWTHIAGTWDGEKLRMYVNGVERAAVEFAGTIAPQNRQMVMGNYMGRKNAYAFTGLLDDVRVFKGALTQEQVFEQASQAP